MTTWANANATKTKNVRGRFRQWTYKVTGVSGDTGGIITVPFTRIVNTFVTGYTSSAVLAALTKRISANTVVVAYTNPSAGHTVDVTVIG